LQPVERLIVGCRGESVHGNRSTVARAEMFLRGACTVLTLRDHACLRQGATSFFSQKEKKSVRRESETSPRTPSDSRRSIRRAMHRRQIQSGQSPGHPGRERDISVVSSQNMVAEGRGGGTSCRDALAAVPELCRTLSGAPAHSPPCCCPMGMEKTVTLHSDSGGCFRRAARHDLSSNRSI